MKYFAYVSGFLLGLVASYIVFMVSSFACLDASVTCSNAMFPISLVFGGLMPILGIVFAHKYIANHEQLSLQVKVILGLFYGGLLLFLLIGILEYLSEYF